MGRATEGQDVGRSSMQKLASFLGNGTQHTYYWRKLLAHSANFLKQLRTKRICPQCRRPQLDSWVGKDTLGESTATHSSNLDWRIPMDRGIWWATIHGVGRSSFSTAEQRITAQKNQKAISVLETTYEKVHVSQKNNNTVWCDSTLNILMPNLWLVPLIIFLSLLLLLLLVKLHGW